jgi:uncharacterized protein (DUF2147 family)
MIRVKRTTKTFTMKKIFLITVNFLLVISSLFAQKPAPGKIIGIWLRDDNVVKIEIYKAGPQYFGRLIDGNFLYEEDGITLKKDENNEVGRLRRRQLKNLTFLSNIDFEGRVYGGTYYDYKTGKWYKSTLKLRGENVLKIRDYAVLSPLGKTTTWTRVQ